MDCCDLIRDLYSHNTMFTVFFTAKNKKYKLDIEKGDILLALDNFLKNNRLECTCLKNVKIRCLGAKDSVSCRIAKIVSQALAERL